MKKLILFIAAVALFSSCENQVQFSDPGFQVYRNDLLLKAVNTVAYKSADGSIRIEAEAQDEVITMSISGSDIGKYYIASTNLDNWAQYETTFDDNYVLYSSRDSFQPITTIANAILTGGTGYSAANSAPTTSTGSGSGMRVKTQVEDGVIKNILIAVPGAGYKTGDIITISGGDNNAKFRILSEIEITNNSNNTLSGYFKFNVKNIYSNPFGTELANFQYGAFYNIPVIPEP